MRVVRMIGIEDFEKAVVAGASAPVELDDIPDCPVRESDARFQREGARDRRAGLIEVEKHRVGVGVDDGDGGEGIARASVGASAHRIDARLLQIAAQQASRADAPLTRARRRDAEHRERRDDGNDGHHDHYLKESESTLAVPARYPPCLFLRQLVHHRLHKQTLFRIHTKKPDGHLVPPPLGKGDATQSNTAFTTLSHT